MNKQKQSNNKEEKETVIEVVSQFADGLEGTGLE